MEIRSAMTMAALAAVVAGVAGCPADECALESPQVSATPGTCTEVASQPVAYRRQVTTPGARRLRIDLAFDGACEVVSATPACVEIIDMKAIPAGTEPADSP